MNNRVKSPRNALATFKNGTVSIPDISMQDDIHDIYSQPFIDEMQKIESQRISPLSTNSFILKDRPMSPRAAVPGSNQLKSPSTPSPNAVTMSHTRSIASPGSLNSNLTASSRALSPHTKKDIEYAELLRKKAALAQSQNSPQRTVRSPPSVQSQRTVTSPTQSQRIAPSPIQSQRTVTSPTQSQRIASSPIQSQRVAPSPIQSQRVAPSPIQSQKVAPSYSKKEKTNYSPIVRFGVPTPKAGERNTSDEETQNRPDVVRFSRSPIIKNATPPVSTKTETSHRIPKRKEPVVTPIQKTPIQKEEPKVKKKIAATEYEVKAAQDYIDDLDSQKPVQMYVPEGHEIVNTSYGSYVIPKFSEMSIEAQEEALGTLEARFRVLNDTYKHMKISFDGPREGESVRNLYIRYKQSVRYVQSKSGTNIYKILLAGAWFTIEVIAIKCGFKASGFTESQLAIYDLYHEAMAELGEQSGFGSDWSPMTKIFAITVVNALVFIGMSYFGSEKYAGGIMKLLGGLIAGKNQTTTFDAGTNNNIRSGSGPDPLAIPKPTNVFEDISNAVGVDLNGDAAAETLAGFGTMYTSSLQTSNKSPKKTESRKKRQGPTRSP